MRRQLAGEVLTSMLSSSFCFSLSLPLLSLQVKQKQGVVQVFLVRGLLASSLDIYIIL